MNYYSANVPTLTDRIVLAQHDKLETQVKAIHELTERLYDKCANTCKECIRENLCLCMDEVRGMVVAFEKYQYTLGENYLTANYVDVLIKLEINFGAINVDTLQEHDQDDFEELMVLLGTLIIRFKGKNRQQLSF
jgi:hypothetical protein